MDASSAPESGGQILASGADDRPPTHVTVDAARFVDRATFAGIPEEALRIGRRCILDTVGLYAAGLNEQSVKIVAALAADEGGRGDAMLLGYGGQRVPARAAARTLGIAAHAHDFDDTQVSNDPRHVYGLLTHPTTAPLSAALVVSDMLGPDTVSGPSFLTAFHAGFEVSCKVSEWMRPDHYLRGHHSSGTVATFGAAMAAGKLLGLGQEQLSHALGIAASMAAGVRCSFGTMCKPWHVGRAAENGVVAAQMAQRGFMGDPTALDGRWGFARILAGGWSEEKLKDGFGRTWSIVEPGVSIKPYPSGILTHQAMDMVLDLVRRENIQPDMVEQVVFFAGDNILNPIRYPIAGNALEAKFSMAALITMLILFRQAGLPQFRDEVVAAPRFQAMQRRVVCETDPEINAMGFELIRSRIEIALSDGRTLCAVGDTRYRGGPQLPLSDVDLENKFRACCNELAPPIPDRLLGAVNEALGSGPGALLSALSAIDVLDARSNA